MSVKRWLVSTGLACSVMVGLAQAQWAEQGEHARLYEKAILDVGNVSLESFGPEDFPGNEPGGGELEGEAVEWLRFQGHATYCFPSGDFPVGRQPVSALILMDPDRKAYLATLKAYAGRVEVSVARIYIIPCP